MAHGLCNFATHFNPRPREEGDHKISRWASSKMDFNPRPREEGDLDGGLCLWETLDFNPRPREEGDIVCDN